MWVDTYDYVRLHQPHPIFTAGNIKWTIDQKPSHLATKPEVLDHLQRCLEVAKKRVNVEERFGWDYVAHEEADGLVHVTLTSPDGVTKTVVTKRLIKAFGHTIHPNAPLSTSSDRVRSTTPELLDLSDPELRDGDAPIWIVGSGKTAMDTAHLLITQLPGRQVSMLAGPGTIFARRDTFFPTGARRWWGGTPINTMARQVANRFDGTNEAEVRDWFRVDVRHRAHPGRQGLLQRLPVRGRARGDHRRPGRVRAGVLRRCGRSGRRRRAGAAERRLAAGTVRHLAGELHRLAAPRGLHPYEPFVSESGNTLSIQMRSSATGAFSSFGGYYLPHLMFRGELGRIGLYAMDLEDLAPSGQAPHDVCGA